MARNGSGTYTVPNSFTSGTAITASDHNENWSDAASEITNSVAADGQTTMTGPLKASNGSLAAPAVSFGSDTDTGLYRIGADNLGIAVGGVKVADMTSTGVTFPLAVTFSTGLGTSSLANDAVTYAKIQNVSATNKLLGRSTSGAGDVEEIGLGVGVSFSGGNLVATAQLPRGYIDGCIISNGSDATNDINIAAGVCRDSTNAVDITVAAMSGKQLDANWAPGGSAGMRNSAVGIADTTYHIYAVAKADGTQDIYAHTSTTVSTVITALQAETGGADYLYARRIASIIRVSSAIKAFSQFGNEFLWSTSVLDVNAASQGGTATLRALTVPSGIKVHALISVEAVTGNSSTGILITSPDESDQDISTTAAPLSSSYGQFERNTGSATTSAVACEIMKRTDTSSQLRFRGACTLYVATRGYIDTRGKDA